MTINFFFECGLLFLCPFLSLSLLLLPLNPLCCAVCKLASLSSSRSLAGWLFNCLESLNVWFFRFFSIPWRQRNPALNNQWLNELNRNQLMLQFSSIVKAPKVGMKAIFIEDANVYKLLHSNKVNKRLFLARLLCNGLEPYLESILMCAQTTTLNFTLNFTLRFENEEKERKFLRFE